MRNAKIIHLRSVYRLPSWQGGDVETARCERSYFGWCRDWSGSEDLTDDAGAMTCNRCKRAATLGWAQEVRP